MKPIHLLVALIALLVAGCEEVPSKASTPIAGGENKPAVAQAAVAPDLPAHVSLNDDEFKAAIAPWLPTIEPCELTLRDEGRGATYVSKEPIVGPFPYGSISKSFTAVLVMKLVELGQLSLDDKLSKFKMDIPGDDSISIRDLLTHISGLPDYFHGVDPAVPPAPGQILSMIRKAANAQKLTREKYHYSNTNYALLSEICSRVGGASFADLMKRYVCQPLNLIAQPWRVPTFDLNWYEGAGNMAGSIQDLATFGEAMATQDKRLLSAKSWKELAAPHVDMGQGGKSQYGFGIIVAPMSVYPSLTHAGTIPANRGVSPFVSMLIVRPGSFDPVSFVAFRRVEWDLQSENALYGAFASSCAALDLKRWIATFCLGPTADQLSKYVHSGAIGPDLGLLLTPDALGPLKTQVGTVKTFTVQSELVHGASVQLTGVAAGSAGSVNVTAQFGPGGRLDGFEMK